MGGVRVSIHALLAECDRGSFPRITPTKSFNPRTPCGVRLLHIPLSSTLPGFQSTHSLRSATAFTPNTLKDSLFQSTHSLRSATLSDCATPVPTCVSIHALLAECDYKQQGGRPRPSSFNPRTPCGVRPPRNTKRKENIMFQSTHSLRSATFGGFWL